MTEALLVALAITQVLDWYTTRTVLARGGAEANPVARAGMDALGLDGFFAVKSVLVLALGFYIGETWALAVLVVFYAAVVAHNFRQFR